MNISQWVSPLLNTSKMLKLTPLDAHNLLLMLQAASNAGFSSIVLEEDALNVLNQISCSIILPHWSIALIIDDLFLALQSFFSFWSAARVLRPVDSCL